MKTPNRSFFLSIMAFSKLSNHPAVNKIKEKVEKFKGVLNHLGLYVGLILYTVIGAWVQKKQFPTNSLLILIIFLDLYIDRAPCGEGEHGQHQGAPCIQKGGVPRPRIQPHVADRPERLLSRSGKVRTQCFPPKFSGFFFKKNQKLQGAVLSGDHQNNDLVHQQVQAKLAETGIIYF